MRGSTYFHITDQKFYKYTMSSSSYRLGKLFHYIIFRSQIFQKVADPQKFQAIPGKQKSFHCLNTCSRFDQHLLLSSRADCQLNSSSNKFSAFQAKTCILHLTWLTLKCHFANLLCYWACHCTSNKQSITITNNIKMFFVGWFFIFIGY